MTTGRAVIMLKPRAPFEIREYELPAPARGGLNMRVSQAGICGSDLHFWHADVAFDWMPPGGMLMGHEGCGVVHELGEGTTTDAIGTPLSEGDRIVYSSVAGCGHCYYCMRAETNLCVHYPTLPIVGEPPFFRGTFADYYCMSAAEAVFKVPDAVPDECLSFINCAMGTVAEGLLQVPLERGQSVVVFGAGGLGLCAIGVARCLGADVVIGLDRQPRRLELAKAFGADVTINIDEMDSDERVAYVRELTGRGVDVVLEVVGNKQIMPEGLQMLARGGTFVQIGAVDPTDTVEIHPGLLYQRTRIMGSGMYEPKRIPMLLNMIERNLDRLPFDRIVSTRYPLEDVDRAFAEADWMTSGSTEVTRAVLVP